METEPLQISQDVYWVGANDPHAHLFEGLWEIPEGVSYNSYLVVGSKKAALIDSVLEEFEEEHLTKIRKVIDPAKIEYIVVNHMEHDHSEALPTVLNAAPNATLIFTPMALQMFRAFFHTEPKSLIIRNDDTKIDLGGKTLRFIRTPFLHWPETMSTYLVEDRILFPCDLFASFHRLPDDTVIDTEIEDIELYTRHASREYFAGVFSRYRDYVLKAIERFRTLGIETRVLAPSHGPVYTRNTEAVLNRWSSWSRPDYARRVVVAVGSIYGSTHRFVEAVEAGIEEAGGEAVICNLIEAAPEEMLEAVIDAPALLIGTATYEYNVFPPVRYFVDLLEAKKMTDRYVGVFGGFAWGGGGVKRLVERLETLGFRLIGRPVEARGRPYPGDLERARELAKAVTEAAFREHGL